jgi:hypothetical protein
MFARIPSVVTSTFGGDAIGDNKFIFAAIVFGATAIISGIGYFVYNSIQKKSSRKNAENQDD